MMSEMLTEMVPGQEDSSDLELLQVSFLANMILIIAVLKGDVVFVVVYFTALVCLVYIMNVGCA